MCAVYKSTSQMAQLGSGPISPCRPKEVGPEDMSRPFGRRGTRTKALVLLKSLATTEDPQATEKEHRGVWHNLKRWRKTSGKQCGLWSY